MWRDRQTGQVAKTHSEIRALRPNWLAPAVLTEDMIDFADFDPIVITEEPEVDAIHIAYLDDVVSDGSGGWVYTWGTREKTPEEMAAELPVVPSEVTKRQGLRALFDMYGLKLADLVAAIDTHPSLTDDEKYLAKVDLEASQTFERYRPLVIMIGTGMGLDLDALFIYAGAIP